MRVTKTKYWKTRAKDSENEHENENEMKTNWTDLDSLLKIVWDSCRGCLSPFHASWKSVNKSNDCELKMIVEFLVLCLVGEQVAAGRHE